MRLLVAVIGLILIVAAFVVLAPTEIKQKTADIIGDLEFLPQSLRDKAEGILLTPAQRREKLIEKLETNLDNLDDLFSDQSKYSIENLSSVVKAIIQESKNLLIKIQEINTDPGPITAATNKIIEEIKDEIKNKLTATTTPNVNEAP